MSKDDSYDQDWDQGDFTDDEDSVYPALEGNTEEDVSWMKVGYASLMPTCYSYL